jgi:hypothetical protein
MSAALADREMTRRNDAAVKIDADVVRKAKTVASSRDIPLAEYLSELLRPLVDRDLKDHARRVLGDDASASAKPKAK